MENIPLIESVRASVIDGRMHNVRYRQRILHRLHDALVKNINLICQAIRTDSCNTAAEADVEFFCAIQQLKDQFQELDFEKSQKEEYSVQTGTDRESGRVCIGLILIRPIAYSRFFSVISPLSAAIAAGNCVLLELEKTVQTQSVDKILLDILPAALNLQTNVFAFTPPQPYKPNLGLGLLEVLQENSSTLLLADSNALASRSSEELVIAVVDRTADLDNAARALLTGRFSFRGKSPYAPDAVFVNEFIKKDFIKACLRYSIDFLNEIGSKKQNMDAFSRKLVEKARKEGEVVLLDGPTSTIIDVANRESELLRTKIRFPVLLIHQFSSLEDFFTIVDSFSSPLLCSYIFATPAPAKYLSQFVGSPVSCINQIPGNLLVGPAAPLSFPVSLTQRYRPEMFSAPFSEFVSQPTHGATLNAALQKSNSANLKATELRVLAVSPLSPIKQPEKNELMGFFEQGIVTGLLVIVLPALVGIGLLAYQGIGFAYRKSRQ